MFKKVQLCLVCAIFTFMLSGCVVRTYRLTRDRVDQNLEGGNRGYLIGAFSTRRKRTKGSFRPHWYVAAGRCVPIFGWKVRG